MLTHVRFATAFQDAIASGQIFPSWANDNFGYGSVGIRFYPPLSAYTLAIAQVLTNDWVAAFLISMYFWMCIGCFGVYLFVNDWGTPAAGLFAAILYAIIPHRLAEIFQFFMYGEFVAWAVIPFCFLFVSRVCRNPNWRHTVLFGLSLSILILTHIPTTIILAFCLPLFVLVVIDWSNFRSIVVHLIVAIILTLCATSFRWVMLVNELTWLAHNGPEHFMSGFYDFRLWLFPNVFTPRNKYIYILTSWLFDLAVVLTASLLIPVLVSVFWRKARLSGASFRKVVGASLVTGVFALFMLSKPSYYIWSNFVLLQKIQFPSRWMSVFSMFAVVLFAVCFKPVTASLGNLKRIIVYPAIAVVFAIVIFDITQIIIPSVPIPLKETDYIGTRIYSQETWRGWWPIWAKEQAFEIHEPVVAGGRAVQLTSWERESKEFIVQPGEPMSIGVKTFYYPLWKANVNDRPVEIGMDQNGVMTIPISGEVSRVRLRFEEPAIYAVANVVSALTWLLPIFILAFGYVRKYVPIIRLKPIVGKEYDYS